MRSRGPRQGSIAFIAVLGTFVLASCGYLVGDREQQSHVLDKIRSIDLLPRGTDPVANDDKSSPRRPIVQEGIEVEAANTKVTQPPTAKGDEGYDLNFDNAPL